MKKTFVLIGLAALATGAAVSLSSAGRAQELNADDLTTYIEMNADAFTDSDLANAAGTFAAKDATFWNEGYHFQALDTFFRGESNEGWTGTLTLKSWKQHTQYIYFTWGGAKNYDVVGDVKLVFHYSHGEDSYTEEMTNNTFVENPMLLRYFKIPDNQYAVLTEDNSAGFDMYIEFIDNRDNSYGFHNFGYLHVNQTEEQVSDAMRYYLNNMNLDSRDWEVNKRKEILNHYYNNAELKQVFLRTVSNIDEGFESNSDFLNHWYFDWNYASNMNWELHFDKAIGTDDYRPADTYMPFNKTGNGFFRGWYQNAELGGFVDGDGSMYRFISRPFVLSSETGLISIKMAGQASLHVIDSDTQVDLAWADIKSFNTSGSWDNLANSDFNTCTMIRHVINLEAYIGRKIQLAFADIKDRDWGAIYFDELIANYENYSDLSFKVDYFTQTNGETFDIYKKDKYVNSTMVNDSTNPGGLKYNGSADINTANDGAILNHVDSSAAYEAYNFLNNNYYSNRADANERINLLNAYYALSSSAKTIVNSSSNVLSTSDTPATVGDAIAALLGEDGVFTIGFDANGGEGSLSSLTLVEGTTYNLPSNPYTAPAGKKFKEWNTSEDGTGTSKAEGNEIEVLEDVTWYAIWVDTAKTKVEAIDTYSTLSYSCNNDGGDFVYSNVKIRFGGYVTKALWDELNSDSEILSYGVMVSLEENESQGFIGSRTFESAYASALAEAEGNVDNAINSLCNGGKIKNFSEDVAEMPYLYEAALSENFDEDTYTWNIAQKVTSPSSLTRVYVAVAYIRTAEGIVFLNESRASAKSIAQDMIDSPEYDEDSFEGSLKYLADLA